MIKSKLKTWAIATLFVSGLLLAGAEYDHVFCWFNIAGLAIFVAAALLASKYLDK